MGAEKRSRRRRAIGLTAVVVVLSVAAVLAADRPRLRAAEDVYLDGRSLTACATSELRPFAEEGRDLDELPVALEEIVTEARRDSLAVQDAAVGLHGGLLPPTRRAVAAVRSAIDDQAALYAAMVDDPMGSDEELVSLGRSNTRAEARLGAARGWLLAGEPDGWDRRFACRDQTSSASSSK